MFPKGVLNMLRRVLCFPKETCQNLADISSVEKCLASAVSHRISPLVDSRKRPCYAYFFNSLGSLHSKVSHTFSSIATDAQREQKIQLFFCPSFKGKGTSDQELNEERRRIYFTLSSDGNFIIFWKILSMKC